MLPHERVHTLKERAMHPLKRMRYDALRALDEVSFTVEPGEFFGIVGRNGSGKSTLLKCLAGIYQAEAGEIYVDGRLSTFIELGVGFNLELPARDNVTLNGIMLGLSSREARERFDHIVEFAELDEFVDTKLKNYSSGMQVRLAFSVMVQVDADVLLVDEVLAVGDAAFQQKCFDVFNRLRDEGRTILLVTHDMAAVKRFCDRALLLEHGRVVAIDEPERVANRYLELNFEREAGAADGVEPRGGDGSARIVEAWVEDEHAARGHAFPQGQRCTFKARVEFERDVPDPRFAVAFVNEQHENLFVASTASSGESAGPFAAGESGVFSVSFENALGPGRYHLSALITHGQSDTRIVDRFERMFSIVVTGARPAGGLVDLPHEARVERVGRR